MNAPRTPLPRLFATRLTARAVLATLSLATVPHFSHAQSIAPALPAELAKYDKNKNGKLDPAELAAQQADEAKAAKAAAATPSASHGEAAVVLSPFTVSTEKDNGFMAANAGTATRLSLDMADVPAAYSVMTRDFIDAIGITNIQEAATWMPGGTPVGDGNGADTFGITTIAAIRGVTLVNGGSSGGTATTRNNYLSASTQDSYNLERYDSGRGPNAALFNIGANSALGGGFGAITKQARYDRAFDNIETKFGSWNYKRATLDVNRPLTEKLAVRGNAVWFDRDGWKRRETEQVKGITGSGSYLIARKTELRVEASTEKTARSIPQIQLYDSISGWDGVTVFREPISNSIYGSQTVAGTPNSLGQVLNFNGESQGVDRRSGAYYVWSPGSGVNSIMNYQNEGVTRAGDATANTPIYANGRLWTRGTGLPFGNSASQTTTPGINAGNGGGTLNFLFQPDLAADRFTRAINGSKWRRPDKRDNDTTDAPVLLQKAKDMNLALTHQAGDSWFFELGGDYNKTNDRRQNINDFRTIRIDINQLLPNGTANPNYLMPYADGVEEFRYVAIQNKAVRLNVAYRANYGKWGDYVVNFNGGLTVKDTLSPNYQYSMKTMADPRLWTGGDDLIRVRHYFYAAGRPFGADGIPNSVFRRDFATDNNSFTSGPAAIKPDWVASGWSRTYNRFLAGGVAASAKYFDGKLVILPALRFDNSQTHQFNSINRAGLPANWDGRTFYFLPDAPVDWAQLTYIPRDANGNPTSTIPIPAVARPRTGIAIPAGGTTNNGISAPTAFYANDRFRDDYNPPINRKHPYSYSVGAVYKVRPWVSVTGNYATSYVLPPTGAFDLSNNLAEVQTGSGYDSGLRFNFFGGRLTFNTNYYFNIQDKVRVTPPTNSPINSLLGRNASTDGGLGSRNNLGIPDIFGGDYNSQRNSGAEYELVATLRSGLRLSFNGGTSKLVTFNRYPLTKVYVPARAADYLKVLQAAGGRLDTTQKPAGAPNAPGLAVVDTSVIAALASEQTGAVTDYNNIWVQFQNVLNDAPTVGVKRFNTNAYADYTIQTGFFRGLRVGAGVQYRGDIIAGYRTGDSVVNAAGQVVAAYPNGLLYPVYTKQPLNTVASLGYSMRLKEGWGRLSGKQVQFQLNVRNVLNRQAVIYQDDTVTPRAPNGDFSIPYRESVATKNAVYQEPISVLFTTTLKL